MIGKTFSHYRLVSELGAGGMGVVYKARDENLPRYVAVKVLRPESTQNQASRRHFLREARAVAAVKHSYIATIHDAGEEDGVLFIAMEYVEGSTLRDILRNGTYPLRDVLHRSCEIAEGLAHVHAAGIIHRDLKPGNIMVSTDGHAKILDFGLAKLVEERDVETSALLTKSLDDTSRSMRVGTPAYMSPEQVRGGSVDQRSDVFAFGCTVFEALTRQSLFGRHSQGETLAAILRDDAMQPSTLNPEVPKELDWILEKCLAKEPRDRYQDTRDLVVDLDHLRWKWESGVLPRPDSRRQVTTHPLPVDGLPGTAKPEKDRDMQSPGHHDAAPGAGGKVAVAVPSVETDRRKRRPIPKRFVLLSLAVVIVGSLLAAVPAFRQRAERTTARTFYTRGLHYLREESENIGSLENATHMFNRSISMDSTTADVWAVLGEAYWMRFQLSKEEPFKEEAESAVARALALDPECAAAINAQGRGLLALGRYEDAVKTLQRAVDRDKKNDVAWANLGRAHQGLRHYAEGLTAIQRAIQLNPQSFRHRISLGNFYRAFQEREAAITAYRQALELKPNSNYAWNNLGSVLLQTASYEKAAEAFRASLAIVENATARSNLGTAYFFMENYEAAEREYRLAAALEPQELAHNENRIDALIKLDKIEEVQEVSRAALPQARALVEKTPQDARALMRLAILQARSGDVAAAMAEGAQSLALEPENVQILFRSAKLYVILRRREQALAALEKAVNLGLSKAEVVNDPDLESLRDDPRYQRILVLAG